MRRVYRGVFVKKRYVVLVLIIILLGFLTYTAVEFIDESLSAMVSAPKAVNATGVSYAEKLASIAESAIYFIRLSLALLLLLCVIAVIIGALFS